MTPAAQAAGIFSDRESMNDAPPLLHIRGVAKTFGAVRALRSADLEVRAGEAHALMGAKARSSRSSPACSRLMKAK
jgi:hypothetical protein